MGATTTERRRSLPPGQAAHRTAAPASRDAKRGERWVRELTSVLHATPESSVVEEVWQSIIDALGRTWPVPGMVDSIEGLSDEEEAALDQGFDGAVGSPDVVAKARARTAARRAALLRHSLTTHEAAQRLGVNESRVRQRLAAHTLYGIRGHRGWLLPAFQFAERGEVRGLSRVLPKLRPDVDPLGVQTWFLLPTDELVHDGEPLSPRDWLQAGGDPEPVAWLA